MSKKKKNAFDKLVNKANAVDINIPSTGGLATKNSVNQTNKVLGKTKSLEED